MEKLLERFQRKHRLGEHGLREYQFRLALLLIPRRADARRTVEKIRHRLGSANARRHQCDSQSGEDRNAIKRAWIISQPGCLSGLHSAAEPERSVARNECVVRLDARAGGASQAHRVPVVYNLILAPRHEEHQVLRFAAILERRECADGGPLCPGEPAQKAPSPITAKASIRKLGLTRWRKGIHKDAIRILSPKLLLQLRFDERSPPMMAADYAVDPRERNVVMRQYLGHTNEFGESGFVTAEAPGLQNLKQPRVDQRVNYSIVGLAISLSLGGGAFGLLANGMGLLEKMAERWRFITYLRHARSHVGLLSRALLFASDSKRKFLAAQLGDRRRDSGNAFICLVALGGARPRLLSSAPLRLVSYVAAALTRARQARLPSPWTGRGI